MEVKHADALTAAQAGVATARAAQREQLALARRGAKFEEELAASQRRHKQTVQRVKRQVHGELAQARFRAPLHVSSRLARRIPSPPTRA